jgi:hypothetical protein
MPRKISTLLNVSSNALKKKGVFDGFVDIDSQLHVDPSLLKGCKIPEFKNAHKQIEDYFSEVLTLITHSKKKGDTFWRNAHRRLQFKEIGNTALGYSAKGTGGSAIGPKLAANILETVSEIVEAGVKDPIIFELIGIFEEGIGADRISDMTIAILIKNFAEYTQRIAEETSSSTRKIKVGNTEFQLPIDAKSNRAIILVPKKLLNDLPVAYDWDSVDRVARYNQDLRSKVNKIIGGNWKKATRAAKGELKTLLIKHPDLLKDLIEQYRAKPKVGYDFDTDPLGELIWAELSDKASKDYPLNLSEYRPVTATNILEVVKQICSQFASLIENNGWFEYLYDSSGKLKHERASQLLFYGIAETYCQANNLDLSRETNAGIGSLDFKVSRGFNAKVNVEVKYSTNTSLVKGFEKQLPAYNKAEKTDTSIYLVIKTSKNITSINRLKKIRDEKIKAVERVPELIFIDGVKQISASKRK